MRTPPTYTASAVSSMLGLEPMLDDYLSCNALSLVSQVTLLIEAACFQANPKLLPSFLPLQRHISTIIHHRAVSAANL